MKKIIALATTASVASAFVGMVATAPNAFAATSSSQDVVHHTVLLRSTPNWGKNGLQYMQPGTQLTEEGRTASWIHVKAPNGTTGYVVNNAYYVSKAVATSASTAATPVNSTTTAPSSASNVSNSSLSAAPTVNFHLPPGVSLDNSITPLAGLTASQQAKANAVLQIAAGKLGTPYIWGHNEDRGQYGFDCSNFTEYVYHHALGYKMSGSSQTQYHSVGWTVPVSSMRPGDLVIFNSGGHVGIYAGNGEMIQEGGGLKKVGYLKLSPGSYWYNHISAVKRMF